MRASATARVRIKTLSDSSPTPVYKYYVNQVQSLTKQLRQVAFAYTQRRSEIFCGRRSRNDTPECLGARASGPQMRWTAEPQRGAHPRPHLDARASGPPMRWTAEPQRGAHQCSIISGPAHTSSEQRTRYYHNPVHNFHQHNKHNRKLAAMDHPGTAPYSTPGA